MNKEFIIGRDVKMQINLYIGQCVKKTVFQYIENQ